jgi:arsenate reductase (thioredoxin)
MKNFLGICFLSLLLLEAVRGQNNNERNNNKPNIISIEKTKPMNFYPELNKSIEKILSQKMDESHLESLDKIADYIRKKQEKNEKTEIIFICTHNSRRSHLAQIWAQTAARHFDLKNISTFSGGTEATAFNYRTVASIERSGFKVENPGGENPKYEVKISDDSTPMICFSKKYSDSANPQQGFLAVMVCDHADEACPVVAGAERRISLPYIDPKKSDGTAAESETYDSRSMQIALEMYYVMSKVQK